MKMSTALLSSVFALALLAGGNSAMAASGKIEAVGEEGRTFTLAGKEYKVSKSRTKITIAGKGAERGDLKVGLSCDVQGEGEASMVACK